MVAKILLLLAALQIACVSATPGLLLPTFGGIGHGRLNAKWFGFKGSLSLGNLRGDNTTDGGLLIQLRIPPGRKCIILLDGVMSATQGIGGHVLVGAQFILGSGIAAGIGGNIGATGFKWGISVNPQLFKKIHYFHFGKYAPILTKVSEEFLKTFEITPVYGITTDTNI